MEVSLEMIVGLLSVLVDAILMLDLTNETGHAHPEE